MSASPTKRRVLATLNVNVSSPSSKTAAHPGNNKPARAAPPAANIASTSSTSMPCPHPQQQQNQSSRPAPPDAESPRKRTFAVMADASASASCRGHGSHQPKKACLEPAADEQPPRDAESRRSLSPAASSVFDSSGIDTTQATTLTEPDLDPAQHAAAAVAAPSTRRALSREECGRRLETLRLRLSLASYKVRTGQTDVPLDRLQIRPMPSAGSGSFSFAASFASSFASTSDGRSRVDMQEQTAQSSPPAISVSRNSSYMNARGQRAADPESVDSSDFEDGDDDGDDGDDDGDEYGESGPVSFSAAAAAVRSLAQQRAATAGPLRSPVKYLAATNMSSSRRTPQPSPERDEYPEGISRSGRRGGAASGLLELRNSMR